MGSHKNIVVLANFFMLHLLAAGQRCHFYQELIFGETYQLYNKEYPSKYEHNQFCLWEARSGMGTKIVISCDIHITTSNNCDNDRVTIYLSGTSNLSNARHYCGDGTVSLESSGTSLSVGLNATYFGKGKFLCTLTTMKDPVKDPHPPQHPNYCSCGWKKGTRIVGGQETLVNEFPLMAGIVDFEIREVFCGGAIVSDNYVVTAAHCVYNRNATLSGVLVGDHNLALANDTSPVLHKVLKFIVHSNFTLETFTNDIALVKTVKKIEFTLTVGPACLPFKYTSNGFIGQMVTALGWGTTEFSGPRSDSLQEVNLQVLPNSVCARSAPRLINYGNMCTYTPGKDACQSDSGGPLLWFDTNTNILQLVGLISYGRGCATNVPGVNTRITYFLPWIISQTPDALYCII